MPELKESIPVTPFIPPEISGPIYGLVGVVLTAAGVYAGVRRKLSRDGVEVTKDRVEESLIKNLRDALDIANAERDKADARAAEAWKGKTEDREKIAQLTAEVKHLNETNEKLTEQMKKMEGKLERLIQVVLTLAPDQLKGVL